MRKTIEVIDELMPGEYEARYRDLFFDIAEDNVERNKERTGVGCLSSFSLDLDIDISKYFPILSGRKMFPHIFESEFKWFISGQTNIAALRKANNNIWNNWADENGDLGPVYGHQLRNFNSQGFDQLEGVIKSINDMPDSRRHVISLWNPAQIEEMALPPCYLYFQFFVDKNNLNMFALMRSADVFLGVPYDVALFAQLLLYVAEKTGYNAKNLSVKFVDAHVYKNQQQAIEEYLNEDASGAPTYSFQNGQLNLHDYNPGKVITAPVAV